MPWCAKHRMKVGEMDDCEKCNPRGVRQGRCSDCGERGPVEELRGGLCPGCVEFARRPPAADPPHRVRVFGKDGGQCWRWQRVNCCYCPKLDWDYIQGFRKEPATTCDLYDAVRFAGVTDGTVPRLMAERMGYSAQEAEDTWLCPERIEPPADTPRDTDFPYIQRPEGDPDGHPREGDVT